MANIVITWSAVKPGRGVAVKGVTDTNTDAATPADDSSDGIALATENGSLKAVAVMIDATSITAGGKLLCWVKNPVTGKWYRASDGSLDFTLTADTKQVFSGIYIPVGQPGSRITWVPSGTGTAAKTIYIFGQR